MSGNLTKAQREWLERAAANLDICPGPNGSSSCSSLVRRGLLVSMPRGFYALTPAGRAALATRGTP